MYEENNIDKKQIKLVFFISITVAFLAQVYLQTNMFNLRISLGIIMLPLCYYMLDGINIIYTGFVSAFFVYATRVITAILVNGLEENNLSYLLELFFPEIFFYIVYFVLFKFIMSWLKYTKRRRIILWVCIACDFCANLSEMFIRSLLNNSNISFRTLIGITIFAVMRSLLIWVIISVLHRYSVLISKKEHELRYKKLLDMTSKLKTELYWMEKSMNDIEQVMSKAYDLYYKIDSKTNLSEGQDVTVDINEAIDIKESALNIARDIHEIKKQNFMVLRGLEEALEDKQEEKGMCIEDIFDILESSTKKHIAYTKKNVSIKFKASENITTKNHYYLMSILRNLIMNAIDAVEDGGSVNVELERERNGQYIFVVRDNGTGISSENIKYLFSPGFSTKINYDTGSINRGLGLSIVKEITENKLDGSIEFESTAGKGTKFMIYIPKNRF